MMSKDILTFVLKSRLALRRKISAVHLLSSRFASVNSGQNVNSSATNRDFEHVTDEHVTSMKDNVASNHDSPEKGSSNEMECVDSRSLPISHNQYQLNLLKAPDQPQDSKTLKVSIIGAPNAGKSSLTNMLLGWRISSTSSKVHTTRAKVDAILTEEKTQLIFLDTPGMVSPKKKKIHHLEQSLLTDPYSSFKDTDLVGVVVDVSVPWGRRELDKEVLKALLMHHEKNSVLILNKIDSVPSRDQLLPVVRILTNGKVGGKKDSKVIRKRIDEPKSSNVMLNRILKNEYSLSCSEDETERQMLSFLASKKECNDYFSQLKYIGRVAEKFRGYSNFSEVFMVSAKTGEGVRELKDYFLDQAKPGDWMYHSSTVTDQDPVLIAKQCVCEKLMDHLPQEIPYSIDVVIVMFQEDQYGVVRIAMELHCYSQRHLSIVLGPRGQRIRQIADQAKQELMNAFRRDITLQLIARYCGKSKKK